MSKIGNERVKVKKSKVKKDNQQNKKEMTIYFICSTFIIILLVAILIISKSGDCYRISRKISKYLGDAILVEGDKDSEDKYSYVESMLIYTEEVGKPEDKEYAISVNKYNSSIEASLKAKYLNDLYKLFHSKIDNTLFEQVDDIQDYFHGEEDLIFTNGIYLIRINSHYKDRYDELESKINSLLKEYDTSDIEQVDYDKVSKYWDDKLLNIEKDFDDTHKELISTFGETIEKYIKSIDDCKGSKCEQYLKEVLEYQKYSEVASEIALVQNKYNEVMNGKQETVNFINSSISKIENNLNQNDYDSTKKQIDELDDTYYDEYKTEWVNRLNAVKEKVYKNSCGSYSYKEVLRTPEDYKGKRAYWFGVVYQKVGLTQYRVGVDCTKYQYIDGYSCNDTIYVYYYGDINLLEDDVVELWGTMNGTVTYESVLGSNITIPSFYGEYVSLH